MTEPHRFNHAHISVEIPGSPIAGINPERSMSSLSSRSEVTTQENPIPLAKYGKKTCNMHEDWFAPRSGHTQVTERRSDPLFNNSRAASKNRPISPYSWPGRKIPRLLEEILQRGTFPNRISWPLLPLAIAISPLKMSPRNRPTAQNYGRFGPHRERYQFPFQRPFRALDSGCLAPLSHRISSLAERLLPDAS